MSDVVDLGRERTQRQLRRSLGLREPPPRLPPVPNALPAVHPGKACGDFVRLRDGRRGWVSQHRFADNGALILTVRCQGRAITVMARDVEPDGAA